VTDRTPPRRVWHLAALACTLWAARPGLAQEPVVDAPPARVLLRMTADSGLVGNYRITVRESRRLVFDISEDDPRAALLETLGAPRQTTTELAVTIIADRHEPEQERRYRLYWLGYRASTDAERGLSGLQWDSIFRRVGRGAILKFSPRGQPQGVMVNSGAVRPVAQALADILSALALTLPADSVSEGDGWRDQVSIRLHAPDGSQQLVDLHVNYRLTRLRTEAAGLFARIEFDGEPASFGEKMAEITGRYFGESLFSVGAGRYESVLVAANLEVEWADVNELPPSRSLVEWQAELTRH
jgi:hypothetical protein